ncbi:TIGR03943 family putative permease subunit [Alicyclobacillus fastidiosus]|uniref:TIGR03943 family protein n=1 Tax=Alicyclobacillus fastidiosus TaxID=392011 RepID=A0ABV5AMJ7_9BACL|nr:TIGR03943 family protein [Alicyclobacillus fastidiosus]WEH11096.1 TIGR03943 family protein [Alicyclobacillus fastidiosus]
MNQWVKYYSRLIPSIFLLFFTVFLWRLIISHDIYLLVSPLIAIVIKISVCMIDIVVLFSFISVLVSRPYSEEHTHGLNCDHHHEHTEIYSKWGLTTVLLLVSFIGLGFTWHPKPLGTNMISVTNTIVPESIFQIHASVRGSRTNSDSGSSLTNWVQLTHSTIDNAADARYYASQDHAVIQNTGQLSEETIADEYGTNGTGVVGRNVSITGFVYHPPRFPYNTFILTRYFIFCCIADAEPVGILVQSQKSQTLTNDEWVSVNGKILSQPLSIYLNQYEPTSWYPQQPKQPYILAKTVTQIPVPLYPYMVPNF